MKLMSRSALHPNWTRHHTPTVSDFMLATIKVIRKRPSTEVASPVYNQATETWSTGAFETVIDNVPARMQPYSLVNDMVAGQDTTGRKLMRVQITNVSTGIQVDDIIVVTASPENPDLMNYTHEVRSMVSSSNAWHTDIICETNTKN